MKKVLFVATVLKKHIVQFHIPTIKMLRDMGWQVDVAAANDYEGEYDVSFCDNYYDIPFSRKPISPNNTTAYKKLKDIIDTNKYDVVHCHTPMGGVIARLAARDARKKGTKVFYTAHGFHFYKGAPKKNWMLYYPAEKYCSRLTDVLITINDEDYVFAKKHMDAGTVEYIPGIGIDVDRFSDASGIIKKDNNKKYLLSVGELIPRKNHIAVIRAIEKLERDDIIYMIAGDGPMKATLEEAGFELRSKTGSEVRLLGYRTDLPGIYKSADVYVFPSRQEGMPVALMEAMAAGVPCIASDVRGNRDLLLKGVLFQPDDISGISAKVLCGIQGNVTTKSTYAVCIDDFDEQKVLTVIKEIYDKQVG